MEYAITYDKGFRHLSKVNEVIFNPKGGVEGWKMMIDFIHNNLAPTQTAIINIDQPLKEEDDFFPFLIELNKERPIKVQFNYGGTKYFDPVNTDIILNCIDTLKENNIKFMFSNVITDKYILKSRIQLGVSDIYIAGGLLHELEGILNLKQKYGFKVRVFPNINISKGFSLTDAEGGWIRPEDTEIYEKYIDVFEFAKTPKASVYFEIYKDRKWSGKIYEIIEDCNINTYNDLLPKTFGKVRATCGQTCIYEKCDYCEKAVLLTNIIEKGMNQQNGSETNKIIMSDE